MSFSHAVTCVSRGVRVAGLSALLVLVSSTAASADPGEPDPAGPEVSGEVIAAEGDVGPVPPPSENGSSAGLSGQSTSFSAGEIGTMQTVSIHPHCKGSTHNPHKSTSFASVHSTTHCPAWYTSTTERFASSNLFQYRWYGWDHRANGTDLKRNQKTANANARWYCAGVGTYTYEGRGYHRILEAGTNYTGWTSRQARFVC
jgi:hypothetical protein